MYRNTANSRPINRQLTNSSATVVAHENEHPADTIIDWHQHPYHQLLYANRGVARVNTNAGTWVLPRQRALWIPAGEPHRLRAIGQLALRSLYFQPNRYPPISDTRVINVSGLLRELILQLMRLPRNCQPTAPFIRMINVLFDQLIVAPSEPLYVHAPEHPRLRKMYEHLQTNPADQRSLKDWSQQMAISERSLYRLFAHQVGMPFGQWRLQIKLACALELLAQGQHVNRVALHLGYQSSSAFVTMFHKQLGITPARYFENKP